MELHLDITPCNCVKSKIASPFPWMWSLFLPLLPNLEVEPQGSANTPALSRLHQVKASKLFFCAVEGYAQCLALFSPTNKVQGDIMAAAAARRISLSASICAALGEWVEHQHPGVPVLLLYQVPLLHLLAPSLSFQRCISERPSQHRE